MKPEEIIKGAERVHKLNEILAELTIQELEYLYKALPAIIEFKKERKIDD